MSPTSGPARPAPARHAWDRTIHEVEPLSLLSLEGVTKTYRDPMTLRPVTAVEGVGFTIERGEIFGLLGPNGAGKTTTIKMILGLVRPTRGTIRLDGRDPHDPKARKKLGYLPESPCFYDHLTASEYLGLVGDLFQIDPAVVRRRGGALLERLGLSGHARKPLRKYSKGMTQRLGLAQALLNEPALLILDEPMSGLDPIGRAEVKQILRDERSRGASVLLSSHVLAETEAICDRVGILSGGRLLESGPVTGLLAGGVREWEVVVDGIKPGGVAELETLGFRPVGVGTHQVIRVSEGNALQELLGHLVRSGAFVHAVEPRRETLEEHFLKALEGSAKAAKEGA